MHQSEQYIYVGPSGREYKLFGCAKWGCDRINTDYEAFGGPGDKSYCRDRHIPIRSKIKLWWQERHG
jgi:hypothetical protein